MTPKKNDPDSPAGRRGGAEADLTRAREEFAATLDELENRLNPKNQFKRARAAVTKRVTDDPKVLAAAAAGAAGLAAAVAGVARLASRGSRH
jgi:hypothetical protein